MGLIGDLVPRRVDKRIIEELCGIVAYVHLVWSTDGMAIRKVRRQKQLALVRQRGSSISEHVPDLSDLL